MDSWKTIGTNLDLSKISGDSDEVYLEFTGDANLSWFAFSESNVPATGEKPIIPIALMVLMAACCAMVIFGRKAFLKAR